MSNVPAKPPTETALATQSVKSADELIKGGKIMSLWEHLEELRTRLIRGVMAFFALFIVCMIFNEDILIYLKQPLINALPPNMDALHFTGPMDVFMVGMHVAGLCALVFSGPVWLYQFWGFVEPALYPKERKHILPFMFASVLLFAIGISFCFFFVLPMSLNFLLTLGMKVGTPMITINDYISLLLIMLFAFAFTFEVPLILVLLGALDIIQGDTLAKHRRIIFVGILILAAIFTPPDAVSMLSMAAPMYLMFEGAILLIRYLQRKKKKEKATV